ncbi:MULTISPECIES: hemerythrin domain-containing protein [Carboxydothermus]|uniref:Hemerythrin-like domain-containing protein n=2 Tax=Carboxydothermus TaxID=129957 RepID=Q3AEJ1_CARHZ|nr:MULTISPECIES: hemerythrin domain-containing protein [Carboxydothermus]ABB15521.1 conserved hypothetical protein [Carboxydothermus hydrogenoformans Z-2901]NYE56466.1 hemerythrin-like domain-containing protein [Carboxydothermus ferrireducens DSM 11255]
MANCTEVMVKEHELILRMLDILETGADKLSRGEFVPPEVFTGAVIFIREFADRFHHGKEEDVFFPALYEAGMPEENSPQELLNLEHKLGRRFVGRLDEAAEQYMDGDDGAIPAVVEAARDYVRLLRQHILKENEGLFPVAERLMSDSLKERVNQNYAEVERERFPEDTVLRFTQLVERFEHLLDIKKN